jgi:hypothetical protein
MAYNPHSVGGHGYIIVAINYFTKWDKVMPTYNNTGKNAEILFFNHIITKFGVPRAIVIDHGTHFLNSVMSKLTAKLGL